MTTSITLPTPAALPPGAMKAIGPVTLDEAEAWAASLGAEAVYWFPATRTAFAKMPEQKAEDE